MNQAMELLRSKAQQLYDAIAGESNIELLIDPVYDEVLVQAPKLEPTCNLSLNTKVAKDAANGLMEGNNFHSNWCVQQLNLIEAHRKVKIWIYNINRRSYSLGNSLVKNLYVPACPEDAEYVVATSLPEVVIQPNPNPDTGDMDYTLFDGRRVAMDLIDPSNLSTDQDLSLDWGGRRLVSGNNFSLRGIFFSTHNPPLKKELKAAHKRLKSYYSDLMERANVVRLTATAPTLGVAVDELKAAQQYVEDSNSNK